jgi:hypothetical protein
VRLLVYTLLRVLLVLAAAGLLHLAGMRSWALWTTAVVVGALASYVVLGRQRAAAARQLAEHDPTRRPRRRRDADAAHEDAMLDGARPEGPRPADAGETDRAER